MSLFRDIDIDPQVVARARAGSLDAHGKIYEAMAPAVYTTALRLVAERAKAEDVLQETFIEVIRSLPRFRGEASLATWVRRIAVSKSLMLLRTAWERYRESEDSNTEPTAPSRSVGVSADLQQALEELPADSRTVVWLHDVEGYTHAEIAAAMDRSVSFSKSRLARAHAVLREQLSADYGAHSADSLTSLVLL